MKSATISIHESQKPDGEYGSVTTPIHQTSTFAQHAPAEMMEGTLGKYDYSRSGNPTRSVLENVLARLENGKHGFVFASGMAAITNLALGFLSSGDHVILGDDVYGGTFRLFDKVFKRFDIESSYVDMTVPNNIAKAIKSNTKMLILETPTNPLLKLADIKAITDITTKYKVMSVVDNTFASPILQRPLDLGADIILHSTTKYINGHSDVVGGALITNNEEYSESIAFYQNTIGATADPLASWLTLRGLKTLTLRMERHNKNAKILAEFLEGHDGVEKVIYPGLASHPQYELAKKQMDDFGGMISFYLKGDAETTKKFFSQLEYFILAESLGGVESLIEIPAVMTHAALTPEARQDLGISDTLIRLSVGIEDIEDLKSDLEQALESITENSFLQRKAVG